MQNEKLMEKINLLPPERVAEVEDFVDFVAQREKGAARRTGAPNQMPQRSALDLLESLPGNRVFKDAADVDDYLREERASWDSKSCF